MFFFKSVFPLLFLWFSVLYGEPAFVSLEELLNGNYDGQEVHTRGFLYELNDHESILSLQPNLKSCCIGNLENKQKQILVDGSIKFVSDSVVEITGVFKVNDSNSTYPFVLENVQIVDKSIGKGEWMVVAAVAICCLGFSLRKKFVA